MAIYYAPSVKPAFDKIRDTQSIEFRQGLKDLLVLIASQPGIGHTYDGLPEDFKCVGYFKNGKYWEYLIFYVVEATKTKGINDINILWIDNPRRSRDNIIKDFVRYCL